MLPDASTPIYRLPYDVLLDIFFLCVPLSGAGWRESLTRSSHSLNTRNAPWSLSQVSQQWRDVSLSSRLLWTFIGLDIGAQNGRLTRQQKYALKLYLQRSGNQPLFVNLAVDVVACYTRPADVLTAMQGHILNILAPTMSRWKGLRTSVPFGPLDAMSSRVFDQLEALVVEDVNVSERLVAVFDSRSFPCLMELCVLHRSSLPLMMEWRNIVEYTDQANTNGFMQRISQMPKLERLHVNTYGLANHDRSLIAPAPFPLRLESLTFMTLCCQRLVFETDEGDDVQEHYGLFDVIDVPVLQCLVFEALWPFMYTKFRFLPPKAPLESLTRLEFKLALPVKDYPDSDDDLDAICKFLVATPNVTHLAIQRRVNPEFFIRLSLTTENTDGPLLLCLKTLDIFDIGFAVVLDEYIMAMLLSRSIARPGIYPGSALERVETCTGFMQAGSRSEPTSQWGLLAQSITIVPLGDPAERPEDRQFVPYDSDYESEDDSDYVQSESADSSDSGSAYTVSEWEYESGSDDQWDGLLFGEESE